jgi:inorganic triphosphatase YgiF
MPMGAYRQEIEWQYDAPSGLEKVEEWLGSRDPEGFGLVVLGGSFKELTDTYYDTGDWRLYRAGCALRVRRDASTQGFEAMMKSPIFTADNLHRRREISEPLETDELRALQMAPGPVGERLRTLAGPREVRPIFEVRTRRRTFALLLDVSADPKKAQTGGSAGASRVGEVVLDDSEIPFEGSSTRLTRVEVEVDGASLPPRLKGFVKAMEVALGLRPTTVSKYEAGLFVTGQDPNGEIPQGEGREPGPGRGLG